MSGRHRQQFAADQNHGLGRHVGRIGALALALGISTAMTGGTGVAFADDGGSPGADSGGQTGGSGDDSTAGAKGQQSGSDSDAGTSRSAPSPMCQTRCSAGVTGRPAGVRNCQYLWIGVFQATSVPAC